MHRASIATLVALALPFCAGYAQHTDSAQNYSSSAASAQYLAAPVSDGGSATPAVQGANQIVLPNSFRSRPFSSVAVGAKIGILGIGFEAATPLAHKLNLRGGANFFSYTDTFTSDGINYGANLHFRSVGASLDYFPWAKGFHLSPGLLLYNGNQITANAHVPAGKSFTLNDTDYVSSATDPVKGNGGITFNKVAPKFTVGWGNLLPRSGRHYSIPFEAGFAYVGDPKVNLNLSGHACYNYQGTLYCDNVATNQDIQTNLAAQRQKLANDVSVARFYPIFSVGFAYAF